MESEVLFFLPYLGGGGAEMNAVRVSRHLGAQGFAAGFAVGRPDGPYKRLLYQDTAVHTLRTGTINSSTLRLIRSAAPLRRLVADRRPSILCPVMDHLCIAALLAMKGCKHRPRVVLNIQNSLRAKLVEGRGLRSKLQLRLVQRLFPAADHVIALSQGVAQDVVDLVPALAGRISVVYNAAGDAHPTSLGDLCDSGELPQPRPDGKLIVACGRLVEQKGYPYLLRAFAAIRARLDTQLWILGEGPERRALQALAASLGVDRHVAFLGFREHPQTYMRAADVFVLSSLWEGFGNVIVEAMAVGTPVVATDCPHGPGEIIEDGINGLLVPRADSVALEQALLRVLADDKLGRTLAAGGHRRAQDFAPERIASQYARVFSNVCAR